MLAYFLKVNVAIVLFMHSIGCSSTKTRFSAGAEPHCSAFFAVSCRRTSAEHTNVGLRSRNRWWHGRPLCQRCATGTHNRHRSGPTDWKSILSEYANINYRFTQAFAYGILAGIKKLTISFLKGNIKYAKGYASTVFSLLKQSKAVIQVRKQTKQIHASYL